MLVQHYDSAQKWFGYLAHACTNLDGSWKAASWGNSGRINLTVTDWMEGDHIIGNGIGPSDWFHVPPDAAATWETWGNSWSAHSADLLANISQILQARSLAGGYSSSANTYSNNYIYYTNMAAKIRTGFTNAIVEIDGSGNIVSFLSTFQTPPYAAWHSTSQGDAVSVLNFDMIPSSQRPNVLTNMLMGSRNTSGTYGITNYNTYCSDGSKCSNHLSTGYALTARAMLEMTQDGFTTNAYKVLTNAEFPSWLYMVTNGFTTTWEGWNTYVAGPNTSGTSGHGYNTQYGNMLCSFNHVAFGAVGEWIWKVMGGINPDDSNPGFQNTILKPEPGGGVTNAWASFNSIRGPVISTWTNNSPLSTFSLTVTVPANSSASVYIPSTNSLADITENGSGTILPATNSPGVFGFYKTNAPSFAKGATVFQVGSGTYRFALTNY
jgi:hypothetical protein